MNFSWLTLDLHVDYQIIKVKYIFKYMPFDIASISKSNKSGNDDSEL